MQHVKLMDIATLTTSNASYVANGSGEKTFIKSILAHNRGSVSAELSVFNVPDSAGSLGTASVSNRFINVVMEPGATFLFEPRYPITLTDTNDAIFASSTVATTINFKIEGAKE